MEISVVASGSNGNCCLVSDKNTSVLIDAGKSCKEIEYRLDKLGKNIENVNAVVLTHSHGDHSQSAGVISRKYNIPLYVDKKVYSLCNLGKVDVKHFTSNFKIKNLEIKPIATSHDVPSSGFVIGNFGIFTDTGHITPEMKLAVKKLKGVLLESNHDIDMLINGRYPAFLKQRILSDNGHLSNVIASSFVDENKLDLVLLGHLSENNNTNELVKNTFETIVNKKTDYSVLSRDKESGTWEI